MLHLQPINRWKSARFYVGATFAVLTMLASVSIATPFASAGASVTGATVTASGTPGISATVDANTTTTGTTTTVDLHFSVTQPANICRIMSSTTPGYCVIGDPYPNWQADLTITGYAAAGLTYSSNNAGFTCTEASGVLSCHIANLNNYFKTFDFYFTATSAFSTDASAVSANLVVSANTATASPTSMDQCKHGGWATFNTLSFTPVTYNSVGNYGVVSGYLPAFTPSFTNQGDCVSSVVSNSHSTI